LSNAARSARPSLLTGAARRSSICGAAGTITVRQLLGHKAGLVLLDEELAIEKLRDLDYLAHLLARQKPTCPPGTRHGYHTMSIGL
jgi:CubicO group peptidase (beta-lactamase class C family)